MKRISVNLTDGAYADLLHACEASGRSRSALVEFALRLALNSRASDNYLLLRLDEGLFAWLKAHVNGIGIAGGMEETAIFMIRSAIIEDHKSDSFFCLMYPHLPEKVQIALRPIFNRIRDRDTRRG